MTTFALIVLAAAVVLCIAALVLLRMSSNLLADVERISDESKVVRAEAQDLLDEVLGR